jgi:hypothetical protein
LNRTGHGHHHAGGVYADHEQKHRTCVERLALTTSDRIQNQIIGVLREQEVGASTAEVCRKHGISDATFYKWKARYGGLELSEAKRLRALEDENAIESGFWPRPCSTTPR